jgi:dTDP-4-amino-4,6-dideoxygalactose transaminase
MRPIHHIFAPMADKAQVTAAWSLVMKPWRYRDEAPVRQLEQELGKTFGGEAFAFGSGREALLAILQSITLQKDEEVIVQGYTCIVVPNAVIAAGMKPVYADIDPDTLNLNPEEVERMITPKTRAIICQHTFGIPAFAAELRKICDRHSLIFIEDCAHVMPDASGPKEIATHGDFLFFSFGRDKAISGVSGGAVICRQKDLCGKVRSLQQTAKPYSLIRIKELLLYPIIYSIAKPIYRIGGKLFLAFCGKVRLLVPIVTREEKHGRMKEIFHAMPGACASLALLQLHDLKNINDHRRMLTRFYFDELTKHDVPLLLGVTPELPLQKFPLFTKNAEGIRQTLKKQNIYLHDGWTGCVICPANADCDAVGYKDGDDPKADMAGEQILSLPTHPTMTIDDAKRLLTVLIPLLKR